MRSTLAIFVFTLVVIVTGLALYSALGIVRNSDDPAAGAAVRAFGSALKQRDGAGACAELTREAQAKLEDERKKPCEQAIVEIASEVEPGDAVSSVNVAESSAFVRTSRGPAFFLDRIGSTWKLNAAGCARQAGDAPYSCALEG